MQDQGCCEVVSEDGRKRIGYTQTKLWTAREAVVQWKELTKALASRELPQMLAYLKRVKPAKSVIVRLDPDGKRYNDHVERIRTDNGE